LPHSIGSQQTSGLRRIDESAQVNANIRRLIEYLGSTVKCSLRRFDGENLQRLALGYRGGHTHFTKGRIDLVVTNVARDGIRQPRKTSQGRSVIAFNKRIGRDSWQLPILQVTKIVFQPERGVRLAPRTWFLPRPGIGLCGREVSRQATWDSGNGGSWNRLSLRNRGGGGCRRTASCRQSSTKNRFGESRTCSSSPSLE
jgi:hypothetical protein